LICHILSYLFLSNSEISLEAALPVPSTSDPTYFIYLWSIQSPDEF
jgi:hypothetical protein